MARISARRAKTYAEQASIGTNEVVRPAYNHCSAVKNRALSGWLTRTSCMSTSIGELCTANENLGHER